MNDRILSIISFITVFVPFTILFVWKPTAPGAAGIAIGYCTFIALSFCFALALFAKKHMRDVYTKIALGLNGLYLAAIFVMVVLPRLI